MIEHLSAQRANGLRSMVGRIQAEAAARGEIGGGLNPLRPRPFGQPSAAPRGLRRLMRADFWPSL